MINIFPFDVIKTIAAVSPDTWSKIANIDSTFAGYALSNVGRKDYEKQFTRIIVNDNCITYYLNKSTETESVYYIHNKYGPAVIYNDSVNDEQGPTVFYYIHNKIHRNNDLPAIEYSNGTKVHYFNGIIHRDYDQPAITCANGTLIYYNYGNIHRDAITDSCNNIIDRPAIIKSNGSLEYYHDGVRYL